MLRADHRQVEELFARYETQAGQAEEKDSVLRQICQALEVHAQLEEEIFYPAVRAAVAGEGQDLVAEAIEEHQTIKDLIGELEGTTVDDDAAGDSLVRQLKECVMHHVREEESQMLPQAEQLLGDQLETLGAQMQQRKDQLLESPLGSDQAQMPEEEM